MYITAKKYMIELNIQESLYQETHFSSFNYKTKHT